MWPSAHVNLLNRPKPWFSIEIDRENTRIVYRMLNKISWNFSFICIYRVVICVNTLQLSNYCDYWLISWQFISCYNTYILLFIFRLFLHKLLTNEYKSNAYNTRFFLLSSALTIYVYICFEFIFITSFSKNNVLFCSAPSVMRHIWRRSTYYIVHQWMVVFFFFFAESTWFDTSESFFCSEQIFRFSIEMPLRFDAN